MTLAECMVALALASIVATAITTVIVTQGRLLRALVERSADAEAMRTVHGIANADLRALIESDIRRVAGDSVAARLFRAVGVPCGRVGNDLLVRFHGLRSPAPAKDSIVLVLPAGEVVAVLTDADAAACTGMVDGVDPADVVVRLPDIAAAPALVLLFESGTYFLRDHAFRYRLGQAGRQPITDERFAGRAQTVALDATGSLLTILLPWPHGQFEDTVRVHFANGG